MERRRGVTVVRRRDDGSGFGERGGAVKERGPSSDTRTELLAAGARLYAGASFRLLGELTTGAVADEAGFHRQTFYRYWETHEQYVDDLVAFVLDADGSLVNDGVSVVPSRRQPADSAFIDMAVDIARYDIGRMRYDRSLDLKVGLWSLRRGHPQVEERLQASRRSDLEALAEGYEQLFDRWGRAPKPPFTCGSIAQLFDGLLHGLVLRSASEDGGTTEELYVDAVCELLPTLSLAAVDGSTDISAA